MRCQSKGFVTNLTQGIVFLYVFRVDPPRMHLHTFQLPAYRAAMEQFPRRAQVPDDKWLAYDRLLLSVVVVEISIKTFLLQHTFFGVL